MVDVIAALFRAQLRSNSSLRPGFISISESMSIPSNATSIPLLQGSAFVESSFRMGFVLLM
jgi:hypothetical protein